ncbi:hypothetical protein EJ06DRAFT_129057 [Trichodelitschia bisporula]|uniref:Uncharacterized protein n=1 Tax=Trichodelitschia bisporula TaxID=703511 RepID=A0A6G1HNR6_9PEZI|nr:hypothetical protein EJ06DRAFT_129057 [Trichodelitschia bisporula]
MSSTESDTTQSDVSMTSTRSNFSALDASILKQMEILEMSTTILANLFLAVVIGCYNEAKSPARPLTASADATKYNVSPRNDKIECQTDGRISRLTKSDQRLTWEALDDPLVLVECKRTEESTYLSQVLAEAVGCVQKRKTLADGQPLIPARMVVVCIVVQQMALTLASFQITTEYLQWLEVTILRQNAPEIVMRWTSSMSLATGVGRMCAVKYIWGVLDSVCE